MSLRVIGSGLGRTGTASLQVALQQLLGGPCYHMLEVGKRPGDLPTLSAAASGEEVDWAAFFAGWEATVDWPTCPFWPQLAATFPDALILHSVRDSFETWWRSASRTIFIGLTEPRDGMEAWHEMIVTLFRTTFTWPVSDQEAVRAAYEAHNQRVLAEVDPDRLLVWQPGDGWEPICERLGLPVPDEPFPHTNTTAEFRAAVGLDS